MQPAIKVKQFITALLLISTNLAMTACSTIASPVDHAYYTNGDAFAFNGGYTRTIFSPSNF